MRFMVRRSSDQSCLQVTVQGDLDFTVYRDFRKVADEATRYQRCEVDLSSVERVDTSALGMLVMLKEKNPKTVLQGVDDDLMGILRLTGLDRTFGLDR